MSKKGIFLSIFLEITKFGQHRVGFSAISNSDVFFSAKQDKNIMFSENFCSANFSHILGHLKTVVFQNDVFNRQKYFFMLQPQIFMYMKNKPTA